MELSIQEIISTLGLVPHPTCGFVKQIFISKDEIAQDSLPSRFDGARPAGQVLLFMVTPTAQIKLHKIRSDQMYHHYMGDPLEVLLLYPNGKAEIKTVGNDLKAGITPFLFIPGDTMHTSRLKPGAKFALLATSEWPGVAPEDVGVGDPDQLVQQYPSFKKEILEFTKK